MVLFWLEPPGYLRELPLPEQQEVRTNIYQQQQICVAHNPNTIRVLY